MVRQSAIFITSSVALAGCSDIGFPNRADIQECIAFSRLFDVYGSSNAGANVAFAFERAEQNSPDRTFESEKERLPFFAEQRLSGRIESAVNNKKFDDIDRYVEMCISEIEARSAR
ncbi:hypothetical protein [Ahrensia sp. R2A130]|uniref:hypothetical protein n=1 Tax=Ahrensia sp. R2A130 TaxID=744979 RepID=UPI000590C1C5|nr:hypothetical protein [Ahrensia sp. R2A130]